MKRPILTRNISLTALVIVFAATLITSMAATAQNGSCSFARAAGTYGTSDSGTVVGIGPRAADAMLTLDKAGKFSGPVTVSLSGIVTHSTASGTYTVNRDCTGSASFSEFDQSGNLLLTATADFFWVNNMRELLFIFTSATLADGTSLALVVNGNAKKLVP